MKTRALLLASIITTALLLGPTVGAIGSSDPQVMIHTPQAGSVICKPGLGVSYDATLTTTIRINDGPTYFIHDTGAATIDWKGEGTVWEYWSQGFASLYGELARSDGVGFVLIAGAPIDADDAWATGGCDASGNLCWGTGWVKLVQPDLVNTVTGSFNECRGAL